MAPSSMCLVDAAEIVGRVRPRGREVTRNLSHPGTRSVLLFLGQRSKLICAVVPGDALRGLDRARARTKVLREVSATIVHGADRGCSGNEPYAARQARGEMESESIFLRREEVSQNWPSPRNTVQHRPQCFYPLHVWRFHPARPEKRVAKRTPSAPSALRKYTYSRNTEKNDEHRAPRPQLRHATADNTPTNRHEG
eukprot:4201082-Prymnesium_polylepis.2